MIRWCSYCQSYLGESAPFDDFSMTHTVCKSCSALGRKKLFAQVDKARSIAEFYNSFRQAAIQAKNISVEEILAQGEALGLKDIDLCVGIIQPILYEIGELWKKGEVTVAHEHIFTEFAEHLVRQVSHRFFAKLGSAENKGLDVLLVCADGNYHTVGVRMIDMAISELGLKTKVITPGLPAHEIITLLNLHRPRILGISLSLMEQVEEVIEIANIVQNNDTLLGTKIIVGGCAIRKQEEIFKGFTHVLVAPNDLITLKKMFSDEFQLKNRVG
ncbi:MAG: cobalamin B12-binding domain-containing protein [Oligoflexales bacterium]|nr:cobalamin B12-binding domain-containing protein [Oligoflexales bacterium]